MQQNSIRSMLMGGIFLILETEGKVLLQLYIRYNKNMLGFEGSKGPLNKVDYYTVGTESLKEELTAEIEAMQVELNDILKQVKNGNRTSELYKEMTDLEQSISEKISDLGKIVGGNRSQTKALTLKVSAFVWFRIIT